MNRQRDAIEVEFADQQTKLLNSFTSKISEAAKLKKDMQAHEQALSKLVADLQDPDSDKERIFHELNRMGLSFGSDGSIGSINQSEQLLQKASEISRLDGVVDLRELQSKVTAFGKDSIQFQEDLLLFEQKIGADPDLKSLEAIEQAQKMANEQGAKSEAVQAVVDRLKAKIKKSSNKL